MACNFKHAQVIKQVFFFALNVKIKTVRLENHHVMKILKKKKAQKGWGCRVGRARAEPMRP